MCGRYMVVSEQDILEIRGILDEISRRFGGPDKFLGVPKSSAISNDHPSFISESRREIFPGTSAPVIILDNKDIVIKDMHWGFSGWDSRGNVINARSETVATKPFFRNSLVERRCLIPSRGFFEWQRNVTHTVSDMERDMLMGITPDISDKPRKFFVSPEDSKYYYMCGIYQVSDKSEEFVILTLPAVGHVASIHDRMPLASTDPEYAFTWLQSYDIVQYIHDLSSSNLELTRV